MRQRQTPNGYVNETSSYSKQLPGGAYINETSVPPPATAYTVAGPTEGTATQPSDLFTSTANGPSNVVATVTDGEGFTTTFNVQDGTFRYTPATSGTKVLSFTNNANLADPQSIIFQAAVYIPPASATLTSQVGPDGQSVTFVLTVSNADNIAITLAPDDDTSQQQGPRNYPVSGNNVALTYDSIPPGSYSPLIDVTGQGGSTSLLGNDFTIVAVSGGGGIEFAAPDAPTIGTATAGDGYVDVYFTAPANTGSNDIQDYVATLSTGETGTGTLSPVRVSASNNITRTATVVARSAAGPSQPSAVSNDVTPAGVYVPSISINLISESHAAIPAGVQLYCAWFDQSQPQNFTAPRWKGTVTTGSGPLVISLQGSQLATGGIGWLIATNSDGNPSTIHKAFSGPVVVQ